MRLLGAHMSIAGGVDKAIERGQSIGCTAIQIFVKNNNQWFSQPLPKEEISRFIKLQKQTGIFVFAHAGYLVNLASTDPKNHANSMKSMLDELERCETLRLPFIVLHPGSHLGQGEYVGIKNVVKNISGLFKSTRGYKVKILLETTAGQGTNLGRNFEELAGIIDGIKEPQRLGICFDTCHAYAAGYDIKSAAGFKQCWDEFDKIIGLEKLLAFHLNDSKTVGDSRKDRHEHIGQGTIGQGAFRLLLNDKRFENIAMVLETPKDPEMREDLMNLKLLRSLIQ
ncbi:deoxyribonuclease IV [candidate division WOR-1 bacterium RIFCSPLOWO2_02_FULL_46_20]|uniref:Probable endonuclease 4 n=2 Tax=Saganbacteria TaxID=1703751 RepID=A0A1F4R457_UNCSA|nr:MAG: deoxyribonuclease IV [candidate division WOR-1 bacterium RIFCSPHIGHO2_02_FULL_45_12]OGC02924.1 MAG: deoxyribonuclease IV [candidate division WOR-1 bacterium RIFCSPLOWO2_02_FULL_46_20]OGC08553.1 MAG: deoxyribonuclease IV [candidate division WOR-1 bacterium RIFCSPLOWO2_12_FULL_45_9]